MYYVPTYCTYIIIIVDLFYSAFSFQVETIGDAYCVACGLHKYSSTHALQIAWMALKMIKTCNTHHTHEGKPIEVRSTFDVHSCFTFILLYAITHLHLSAYTQIYSYIHY